MDPIEDLKARVEALVDLVCLRDNPTDDGDAVGEEECIRNHDEELEQLLSLVRGLGRATAHNDRLIGTSQVLAPVA